MKPALTAALLLLTLTTTATAAVDISGVLRPEFSITDQPFPDSTARYLFQSTARIMMHNRTGDVEFNAAYVLSPSAGNPALSGYASGDGTRIFRITDPDSRILPSKWEGSESFSLIQNIDRLNVGLRTSIATITLGRQAIYWGVAKSVSPTDFIAPFQYGAVNTEYRTGVDAFRAVLPIGMMSELDCGYVFGNDARFSNSGCWIRGRFYMLKTDATLLLACFRDNLMIGGSLNRSIGGGTGWVELAIVSSDFLSEEDSPDEDTFWSLSTGYDTSWLNASIYGYLEYHFSSPGSSEPENYPAVQNRSGAESGIYLMGRHYLCPGLSWTPMPLLKLSSGALINLADLSAYLSVSGNYSVGQNLQLECGANLSSGSRPNTETGNLRSEFGSWPSNYFVSLGYYF